MGNLSIMWYNIIRMKEVEIKNDTRNLQDEYKGLTNEQVFVELSKNRSDLEVAIENVEHDFNVGTIVRSAPCTHK